MNPSSPSNSQNYNRFSYVLNNPLKYVDPSGYVALNPWYEYQAGPKTFYTWMPDYHTDGTYPDNQGRIWKYHGETINTPGFYGDETGMWISKLNEHNELIYNYNELRQVVQNNANSNSFFSSFSMGAGTFRVEGEVHVGDNPATNTFGNSGNPVQTASDVNNYFGIFISAADQVIKNTKFGSNIAYAISGNSNLVSAVNNGLKVAPYVGLGVTIYTGTLLSTTINPATNKPYQSWLETGTDIGANLGIIYIGTQFGGWWGAGAAAFYLGAKYTSKQQMNCYENNGMNPGMQFIFFKQ